MVLPSIKALNLQGKRIFLRVDLNVPLDNGLIVHDFRLKAILPTLQHILKAGGKIILATHLGRPHPYDHSRILYDESLSTKHLLPWFKDQGFLIDYEKDLVAAHHKSRQYPSHILLLENLRFFHSERETNQHFAELLGFLGDLYINDAFAMIHRHDTSVTLLAQQFQPENRAFGLLAEKELGEFLKLRENKNDALTLVIGGNKVHDKIPMLKYFMNPDNHPNLISICVGGGVGLAFLKAQGYECGSTVIDDETIATAQEILTLAGEHKIKIVLPEDHVVSNNTAQELFTVKTTEQIPSNGVSVDIGPQTIQVFTREINQAKLLFANGTMGIYEKPASAKGTRAILDAIANTQAHTVVGGGDTVAAACLFGFENKFSFTSTGGGATLAFLGCETPETEMPALAAMLN